MYIHDVFIVMFNVDLFDIHIVYLYMDQVRSPAEAHFYQSDGCVGQAPKMLEKEYENLSVHSRVYLRRQSYRKALSCVCWLITTSNE